MQPIEELYSTGYFMEPEIYGVIPVISRTMGKVYIPSLEDGEYGIVSSMVINAAKSENHPLYSRLYAPDTGATAIRDKGQVVAVTRLVH